MKASKSKSVGGAPAASADEDPFSGLEPVGELTLRIQALIDGLQAQADKVGGELNTLRTALPRSTLERIGVSPPSQNSEEASASAPHLAAAAEAVSPNTRKRVHRVWRGMAEEKLAEMASSLEAAMQSDDKLRQLFDHIDLDGSGTLDRHEIEIAMRAAGKSMTDEQLDKVMAATDEDGNGDIDFAEFATILKGVKASNAATVIGRQFHKHQTSRSYLEEKEMTTSARHRKRRTLKPALNTAAYISPRASSSSVVVVASVAAPPVKDRDQLARLLADVFVRGQADPRELVHRWDRRGKGAITRVEFRVGVREGLGLNAENGVIDQLFEQFDRDQSGAIDVPELRDGLESLLSKARAEEAEVMRLAAEFEVLHAKLTRLTAERDAAAAAVQAAFDARDRLTAYRSLPHIGATVGGLLAEKVGDSDGNQPASKSHGVTLGHVVEQWSVGRVIEGRLGKEEFVKMVGSVLSEGVNSSKLMRRQKSEATQLRLDSALTLDAKERVRAEMAIREALGDEANEHVEAEFVALEQHFAAGGEASTWRGVLAMDLPPAGAGPGAAAADGGGGAAAADHDDADADAAAAAANTVSAAPASAPASAPAPTSSSAPSLPIEPTIVAMMRADEVRKEEEARLVASCEALRAEATRAQRTLKSAVAEFEEKEAAEAATKAAEEEARRAAEAEAKAREKEAAMKAKEEAAAAHLKSAVQPRYLTPRNGSAPAGAPAPALPAEAVW